MQNIEESKIISIKKEIPVKLGRQIKVFREKKNFSQNDLALLMGKDRQYIYKMEKGIVNPTISTIALLCLALEISVEDLVRELTI